MTFHLDPDKLISVDLYIWDLKVTKTLQRVLIYEERVYLANNFTESTGKGGSLNQVLVLYISYCQYVGTLYRDSHFSVLCKITGTITLPSYFNALQKDVDISSEMEFHSLYSFVT